MNVEKMENNFKRKDGGVAMNIKEIIESEARRQAEEWAKIER